MNEKRIIFLLSLHTHMKRIAKLYKEAYPDAGYLVCHFSLENGTMSVNNAYYGEDSEFPISELYDCKDWYDYRKGCDEQ